MQIKHSIGFQKVYASINSIFRHKRFFLALCCLYLRFPFKQEKINHPQTEVSVECAGIFQYLIENKNNHSWHKLHRLAVVLCCLLSNRVADNGKSAVTLQLQCKVENNCSAQIDLFLQKLYRFALPKKIKLGFKKVISTTRGCFSEVSLSLRPSYFV